MFVCLCSFTCIHTGAFTCCMNGCVGQRRISTVATQKWSTLICCYYCLCFFDLVFSFIFDYVMYSCHVCVGYTHMSTIVHGNQKRESDFLELASIRGGCMLSDLGAQQQTQVFNMSNLILSHFSSPCFGVCLVWFRQGPMLACGLTNRLF